MAWYDQYFTPQWKTRFHIQTSKVFEKHPQLVDDAFQNAWKSLYLQLTKESQEEVEAPYVFTIFKHLLLDDYREHFGRCRPFQWVKRLGIVWERIAKLLCHDTQASASIIAEQLGSQAIAEHPEILTPNHIESIVIQLKAKEYCSNIGAREQSFAEIYDSEDSRYNLENNLQDNELKLLLDIILGSDEADMGLHALSEHIIKQWQALGAALDDVLSDDDRLVLVLIYVEGYKVTDVARSLNQSAHKIRYQLKRVLAKIHDTLQKHAVDLSLVMTSKEYE